MQIFLCLLCSSYFVLGREYYLWLGLCNLSCETCEISCAEIPPASESLITTLGDSLDLVSRYRRISSDDAPDFS